MAAAAPGREVVDLLDSDDDGDVGAVQPPEKRQKTCSSDEDVKVVEPVAAGPSRAAANTTLVGDLEVVDDSHVLNVNRDLPHDRSQCCVHPFQPAPSTSNAAFCAKCFCAKCDKPASECKSWGTGADASHHCNLRRADIASSSGARQNAPAGVGPPPGFMAAMHTRYPYGDYSDYDSEEDSDGDSPMGYGYFEDYDDYGLPYAVPRYGGYVGYGHGGHVEQEYNVWHYNNEDQAKYVWPGGNRSRYNCPRDLVPSKPTLKPIAVSQPDLADQLVYLGQIRLPVQLLNGLSLEAARKQLAKAPWGYIGNHAVRDWRSWELYWDRKLCLSSIMLHQGFPEKLSDTMANVIEKHTPKGQKAPALPKPQVKLLPLEPLSSDPQLPETETTIRLVLFIDCEGSTPLQIVGITTSSTTTWGEMRAMVAEKVEGMAPAMDKKHCLILGMNSHYGFRMQPDDYVLAPESKAATSASLSSVNSQVSYGDLPESPLLCWRVKAVPRTFKGKAPPDTANYHYLCVSLYTVREHVEVPSSGNLSPTGRTAIKIPVPILVAVDASITPSGDKASCNALAKKVKQVLARWVRPGQADALNKLNLSRNLLRSVMETHEHVRVFPDDADLLANSIGLHRLRDKRWKPPTSGYPSTYQSKVTLYPTAQTGPRSDDSPVIMLLHCILDDLPAKYDDNLADPAYRPTAPVMFDLPALFRPACKASAAPEIVKENERVVQARKSHMRWSDKVKAIPRSVIQELLELAQEMGFNAGLEAVSRPAIRVKTSIEAPSGRRASQQPASGAYADLVIDVHVFASEGTKHKSVVTAWDNWPQTAAPERYGGIPSHRLHTFIGVLLRENTSYNNALKALSDTASVTNLSLANVLDKIEASNDLPEAAQPAGFTHGVQLRPYQKQALAWMIDREREPLRSTLWWKVGRDSADKQLWYSPVFARLSLNVPEGPRGGFLAEEMGLGKTVEILALHLANPPPPTLVAGSRVSDNGQPGVILSRATLVICKVSLVGQWVAEAKSKLADAGGRICEYHGSHRVRDVMRLATAYDIVVTTYDTLASDLGGRSKIKAGEHSKPISQIRWWRIVLDESHTAKDSNTKMSKAVGELQALRRWACTGTPINTDTKDLVGQFAALHMEPLSQKGFFNMHIKHGLSSTRSTMLWLLKHLMMRHSKKALDKNGTPLLSLPEKTEELIPVKFSEFEWNKYMHAYAKVKATYQGYEALGAAYCNSHQLAIMALLSPLRRLCSGGSFLPDAFESFLTPKKPPAHEAEAQAAAAADDAGPAYPPESERECPICMDDFDTPVRTPCHHWFCQECISAVLQQRGTCPMCRGPVRPQQLRAAVFPEPAAPADDAAVASTSAPAGASPALVFDSKVKAVMAELLKMREADPTGKALIFTQYNDTIGFLTTRLREHGFSYRTISGSMPMKQRAKAIEAFQNDPPTTVFILSLRSGAVGINLTSANQVFMMEPVLNPALDEQAVGRAWRMGQKRKVTVKRLFIKGTIEESIMSCVKARGSRNFTPEEVYPTGRGRKSMNVNQVAGAMRSDKAILKMDELKLLFAPPVKP